MGKTQVRLWNGKDYFISFINDYSDEITVSLMRTKGEASMCYKVYEAWIKSHCGAKGIKTLQSD